MCVFSYVDDSRVFLEKIRIWGGNLEFGLGACSFIDCAAYGEMRPFVRLVCGEISRWRGMNINSSADWMGVCLMGMASGEYLLEPAAILLVFFSEDNEMRRSYELGALLGFICDLRRLGYF